MTAERAVQLVAVSFGLFAAPPFIAQFFWSEPWVRGIALTSVVCVMIAVGLFGLNRWSRTVALVWIEIALFFSIGVTGFITTAPHGVGFFETFYRQNVSGSGMQLVPYLAVIIVVTIWQRRALRRNDVRALFGLAPEDTHRSRRR
ncbi:MAG: hypothetical protein IT353_07915 [Gemmatimonadaceae bacterium]|nr:hypothetical protein [Gemmatimonadaceae bacterium]